jgi:hypothetical protein
MTDDGNPPLGFVGYHAGSPQDVQNLNLEHSVSPQDVKYQFTFQGSYDLPVGKGRLLNLNGAADALLGGWTTNAIYYISSGVPIASPVVGATTSYFNQRTNLTCDPSLGAPHTATRWFNDNCFVLPSSPYIAGNAPAYLDHVRTMGANDLDLSFYKSLHLGKERELRFEIAAFNVANKVQLAAPGVPTETNLLSNPAVYGPQFGVITADSNTPRQFQFGSRFTF